MYYLCDFCLCVGFVFTLTQFIVVFRFFLDRHTKIIIVNRVKMRERKKLELQKMKNRERKKAKICKNDYFNALDTIKHTHTHIHRERN